MWTCQLYSPPYPTSSFFLSLPSILGPHLSFYHIHCVNPNPPLTFLTPIFRIRCLVLFCLPLIWSMIFLSSCFTGSVSFCLSITLSITLSVYHTLCLSHPLPVSLLATFHFISVFSKFIFYWVYMYIILFVHHSHRLHLLYSYCHLFMLASMFMTHYTTVLVYLSVNVFVDNLCHTVCQSFLK